MNLDALMSTADTSTPPSTPHRPVRTFVKRAGRMGSGQVRALQELSPRYVLPFTETPLDYAAAFNLSAPQPTVLEIGFGMGSATAQIAQARPDTLFIGCEVHDPGVGALLKHIEALQLSNLRIIAHDAVQVLHHMIAPASLAGIHIFFPDPWHKKRHHKRRLIQPELVALLASRLQPGGVLHLATDWQPYAEQMLSVLNGEPALVNTVSHDENGGFAPRPSYRPLTKFEHRGLKLGHGVWDLIYQRQA
jgi:tRNA (guanine-N7-)-methyltransferase